MMIRKYRLEDCEALYRCQTKFLAPNLYPASFEAWRTSMFQDTDGAGRELFRDLRTLAACDGNRMLGYVQFGRTAFGFDGDGRVSDKVSYPVIRSLYFDRDAVSAGDRLLRRALEAFRGAERIYAFYQYFGMSCNGRHGKLFGSFDHVERLLDGYGFLTDEKNVFYSSQIGEVPEPDVQVVWEAPTPGNQQSAEFRCRGRRVGDCEVHFFRPDTAYLRWFGIEEPLRGQGRGGTCMNALRLALKEKGIRNLDTDTAFLNTGAQRFYERNGFTRMGTTRSFRKDAGV